MRKILFCDIDGTLVHGKCLYSVKDLEGIRALREAGHLVTYCTTRNQAEAYSVINHFHLPYDYLILNNGSCIEDKTGKKLHHRALSSQRGTDILRFCLNYPDFYTYFCLDESAGDYDMIGIKRYKTNDGFSEFVRIARDIRKYYGAYVNVSLNLHALIITAKNQTKASAIRTLLSLLNEKMEVFCIGDSCNDTCMFPLADKSFAFFRSESSTRAAADILVPYVYEAIPQIMTFPAYC